MTNLQDYFSILQQQKKAKYIVTKQKFVNFDYSADETLLWSLHDKILNIESTKNNNAITSLLDLKWELARRLTEKCRLCERNCNVNRLDNKHGFCGVLNSKIGSEFVHYGEEPELVPSYTIFYTGCTFKCVYCQNYDISQYPENGIDISPRVLAKLIERTASKNVNFVGGEPTPNLLHIVEILSHTGINKPIIWNSNMYMSEKTMKILDGIIDLYLSDFKYGNNDCAKELSKVDRYFDVVARNHIIANKQTEMIIRHLVLPGHIECCTKPILDWLSKNLNIQKLKVNVMAQYRPEYKAHEYEKINKKLTLKEYTESYNYAKTLNIPLVSE